MRVLPDLCKYCKQNPHTVINTICGVHEFKMYNQTIRFMVHYSPSTALPALPCQH